MVLLVAYATGKDALAEYTHPCSPKKFTQPQLFACLVLKTFLRTDYRGLACLLEDLPDLRRTIDLKRTPHFTTFQKAAHRLLRHPHIGRLLDTTVRRAIYSQSAASEPGGADSSSAGDSSGRSGLWFGTLAGEPDAGDGGGAVCGVSGEYGVGQSGV